MKVYNKLSVLIPAYNEAARIEQTLSETVALIHTLNIPYEIIVIDDGSTDNTYTVATQAAAPATKVYRMPQNGGKGAALKTAFQKSEGDLVLFLDADLDIHPNQLVPLLDNLRRAPLQGTVGSKLHPQSDIEYPLVRRILSKGYALLVRSLFNLPLQDTQTGIKLFESNVLKKVFSQVQLTGFAFDLELLALATRHGFTIREVPIQMRFGKKHQHITPKVIFKMFADTISLFLRLKRMPQHAIRSK